MKNHAEDPSRHIEPCESDVVLAQRVGGGDIRSYFSEAIVMSEEVKEGEEDRERFLHAQKSVERPFAVELEN